VTQSGKIREVIEATKTLHIKFKKRAFELFGFFDLPGTDTANIFAGSVLRPSIPVRHAIPSAISTQVANRFNAVTPAKHHDAYLEAPGAGRAGRCCRYPTTSQSESCQPASAEQTPTYQPRFHLRRQPTFVRLPPAKRIWHSISANMHTSTVRIVPCAARLHGNSEVQVLGQRMSH
jgi:hypothetical protein